MAEISVKSPQLKDREISTYRFVAEVTLNGACCSTIDINDLSVAGTTTGFTLSCFECASDFAIDSSRQAGVNIIHHGTVSALAINPDYAACGLWYPADITILASSVSGVAGSRAIAFDVNLGDGADALDLTADTITDALVEFIIPVKNKDF